MGLLDVTCRKCRKRFGWRGELRDRPPCPKCGDVLPIAELIKAEKEMEKAVKELFGEEMDTTDQVQGQSRESTDQSQG